MPSPQRLRSAGSRRGRRVRAGDRSAGSYARGRSAGFRAHGGSAGSRARDWSAGFRAGGWSAGSRRGRSVGPRAQGSGPASRTARPGRSAGPRPWSVVGSRAGAGRPGPARGRSAVHRRGQGDLDRHPVGVRRGHPPYRSAYRRSASATRVASAAILGAPLQRRPPASVHLADRDARPLRPRPVRAPPSRWTCW